MLDSFAKIHQAEEAVAKPFCDKQNNPFIVKFECITILSLSLNSLDRVAGKLSRFSTHQQLEETLKRDILGLTAKYGEKLTNLTRKKIEKSNCDFESGPYRKNCYIKIKPLVKFSIKS